MADVRINGKRFPTMQAIATIGSLVGKLEAHALKNNSALTQLFVNGSQLDIDNVELHRMKLDAEDTVEAFLETAEQLSLDSLFVAQEMAELLVFDIKVATLQLWDNTRLQNKSLETLISDCNLFLTLGARPVALLGVELNSLPQAAENCLRELDKIANHVEDTTLLAVNGKNREACEVLLRRLLPSFERWLGLTVEFGRALGYDPNENYEGAQSPTQIDAKTVASKIAQGSHP